eukprot:1041353-Amphidinium_carterae.2
MNTSSHSIPHRFLSNPAPHLDHAPFTGLNVNTFEDLTCGHRHAQTLTYDMVSRAHAYACKCVSLECNLTVLSSPNLPDHLIVVLMPAI